MATTGRPPKPIEQKRLAGNPGKRRLPARSSSGLVPAGKVPPVPIGLREHGRGLWHQVWSGPARVWLSPDVDHVRVVTVCRLQDDIAEYRRLIEAMGAVLLESVVTPTGVITDEQRVVANPLVKMQRDAEKQLDRELTAIGFDPVSRSRLGLAAAKQESILERLISGRSDGAAEVIDIAAD